jgi:toxin ParE1/3/4
MTLTVLLTEDAARDLEELHAYITEHDAPEKAAHVLTQIAKAFTSLAESPNRGPHPKELLALGIRDFREIYFKPYRIIYRVLDNKVYVMMIVDGRRSLQELLQRRLLGQ